MDDKYLIVNKYFICQFKALLTDLSNKYLIGDIYFVDQEKLLPTYHSSKLLIVDLLAEPKYCQMIFQTDVLLITIT